MRDDLTLTTDVNFGPDCKVVLDESDEVCSCELLVSTDVADINGSVQLIDDDDEGATLGDTKSLQIDGNRSIPYDEKGSITCDTV